MADDEGERCCRSAIPGLSVIMEISVKSNLVLLVFAIFSSSFSAQALTQIDCGDTWFNSGLEVVKDDRCLHVGSRFAYLGPNRNVHFCTSNHSIELGGPGHYQACVNLRTTEVTVAEKIGR